MTKTLGTLYRPRGVDRKTGREKWVTTDWYRSRKDALQVIKMFGSHRHFRLIKIVPTENHQYNGRYIKANRISTMF